MLAACHLDQENLDQAIAHSRRAIEMIEKLRSAARAMAPQDRASYFSELLSFTGFAIATWSLGAVFVLLVSAANLIPRAFQVHRWYREKFADYPSERKVLVPFLI